MDGGRVLSKEKDYGEQSQYTIKLLSSSLSANCSPAYFTEVHSIQQTEYYPVTLVSACKLPTCWMLMMADTTWLLSRSTCRARAAPRPYLRGQYCTVV